MKKALTIGLVLCIAMSIAVGSAGALSNSDGGTWLYQREITIQENSGKTLANYQVIVELTGSDFPSETQSDGDDIRFACADGKELSYWIEEYDYSGKHATIWVNVPNVPANGKAKIKMYYGNPSASSQSNGDATFDIFEDFDVDDGEWTEYDPNNKIELDYTTDHRLVFNNWIRTDPGYVYKSCSAQNFVEEYEIDITNYWGNANTIGPGFSDTIGTKSQWQNGVGTEFYAGFGDIRGYIMAFVDGNKVWAGSAERPPHPNSIDVTTNTIYYVRLEKFEDRIKLSIFSNPARTTHIAESPKEVTADLADTSFGYYYLVAGSTAFPPDNPEWTTGWMDNFKVRKYTPTEPTITVGAEQPMPTPTNLLKNPGFEDGFSNWEQSTEEWDVDFYIGASAHSGSKSGGIHIMSSGGWGHYSQEVPISNCKNIHAEVWANLAFGGDDKAELAVQTYDADDNLLDHEHKSVDCTEWTKISLDFSPDPNAVSAVVFLDGTSTGEDYVIFDDAYLGVSGSTIPSPAASADTPSLLMQVGEFRDITFTVSNNGGDSDTDSYLSVSVSPGLQIEEWSSSSTDMNFVYSPVGSEIWNSEGNKITSEYELLDAYEAYSAGETNTITIKVKATASGSQWIKYRTAFDTLGSGYNFIRNPTSGPQDQQKWHIYEIPAVITNCFTLEFEGYDLNKKEELKININGFEDDKLCLPREDDPSRRVWKTYQIDITNCVLDNNPHNIITFCSQEPFTGIFMHAFKDIKILKNGTIIYRFHPNTPMGTPEYSCVAYDFDLNRVPATCVHAGKVTMEMYAPTEIKKGKPCNIIIVVRVPRNERYFTTIMGKGMIDLCYSEKIDVREGCDPFISLRLIEEYDSPWNEYTYFAPQKVCDLRNEYFTNLMGEVFGWFIPGYGFTTNMIEEAKEECDFGYCQDDDYDCGPPSSADWKNINEFDTYHLPYDSGYQGLLGGSIPGGPFPKEMDNVEAYFPLRINEPGEYTIHAFFEGQYGLRKKIGKELDWTIKVVE